MSPGKNKKQVHSVFPKRERLPNQIMSSLDGAQWLTIIR